MQQAFEAWELMGRDLAASLTLRVMLAAFSAIALHELGHLFFGQVVGLPVRRVVIEEGRRLFGWRRATAGIREHSCSKRFHRRFRFKDGKLTKVSFTFKAIVDFAAGAVFPRLPAPYFLAAASMKSLSESALKFVIAAPGSVSFGI
jgi:hypothetical protein